MATLYLTWSVSVFAEYQNNIDDQYLLDTVMQTLPSYFDGMTDMQIESKSSTAMKRIETMIDITASKQQIARKNSSADSYKEFVLLSLYDVFGSIASYPWSLDTFETRGPRIIETDLARILVKDSIINPTIVVSWNTLYLTNEYDDEEYLMVDFFDNKEQITAMEFINMNIVSEKCEAYLKDEQDEMYGVRFKIEQDDVFAKCGIYGDTNGVTYIQALSSRVMMYTAPGQWGIPVYLDLIEPKI